MDDIEQYFKIAMVGPGLWQAFNRATKEAASPRYTNREACKYYVERELKAEMEEQIEDLLATGLHATDVSRSSV